MATYGTVKSEPGPYQPYQSVPSGADTWEKDAKRNFIVKVYSILAIQLGFTVLCCGACMYYDPVRTFVVGSGMLCFYAAMIMSFVLVIALFCNKNSYPLNVYLLGCFTFCESWLVGTISALYQEQALQCRADGNAACSDLGMLIWVAWGITFAIFLGLTAFVVLSKWDFSFMGMYLFAGSFILMGWGLVNMLLGYHHSFIYSAFGAALMSGYIIYDTDTIMKRMGPDDWPIACVELYLDIINLFLFILDMLGGGRN